MKKTVEEMVAHYARSPKANVKVGNYVVFLHRWDEIREARAKGFSYRLIWEAMKADGVVDYSYSTFTYYVRKLQKQMREERRKEIRGGGGEAGSGGQTLVRRPGGMGGERGEMPIFGGKRDPENPVKF